jgi:SpoVK/Ycf46/Vps4 family AAA+-type ATPase
LELIGKDCLNKLYTSKFDLKSANINISKHYNTDFEKISAQIEGRLSEKKSKGIVLLHGKPGTGKTSYIRHLISSIDKPKIYLPTDLSHHLASPDFLPFLQYHSDSILIIEDAENIIQQRQGGDSGAISNLLNLCDGLLSDLLHIQIVCTFNTSISKIDSALLRQGRLIASYYFDELSIEKAQQLVSENNLNFEVKKSMTLAEIFNGDVSDNYALDISKFNGAKTVGFRMQPILTDNDYLLNPLLK